PRRFTWRMYPDQINNDAVRTRLWDPAKPEKGGYLQGTEREGWVLTQSGLRFAKTNRAILQTAKLEREPQSSKERNWQRRERERMVGRGRGPLRFKALARRWQPGNLLKIVTDG